MVLLSKTISVILLRNIHINALSEVLPETCSAFYVTATLKHPKQHQAILHHLLKTSKTQFWAVFVHILC